jgi:hypothetical protein
MARKRKPKPDTEPDTTSDAMPWQVLYMDVWEGGFDGHYVSRTHRVLEVTAKHVVVEQITAIKLPGEVLTDQLDRKELSEVGAAATADRGGRKYHTAPHGSEERARREERRQERERRQKEQAERYYEEVRRHAQEWEQRQRRQEKEREEQRERDRQQQDEQREREKRTWEEVWRTIEQLKRMQGGRGYRPQCLIDLDLPAGTTREEIKKKMRELTLLHHPDRGGNAEDFIRINGAYELALVMTPE